jgi:hypothetical protein
MEMDHRPCETLGQLGRLVLCSPEDQWSLVTKYVCPQSAISEITNKTVTFIDRQWAHLLCWDAEGILSPVALQSYANTLYAFGAPSHSISMFLDCTIRKMCHPGEFQELVYTGYKSTTE